MAFLILNAGSSSLKFSLIDPNTDEMCADGVVEMATRPNHYAWRFSSADWSSETVSWHGIDSAIRRIVSDVRTLGPAVVVDAVVHRIVHGGSRFTGGVLVTADVRAALPALTDLAPLHNPPSLEAIDVALDALPNIPHIAVFDTAFHATLPPEAFTYPLPFAWTERWELRRFGFHGFSHEYCARRAAEMAEGSQDGMRTVVAHLGNGASVTAIRNGVSVDTSMGFTPLEGLMMGTRSGSIDPGLLLHLLMKCGIAVDELDRALNLESGLLGVSGVAADMRQVADAARAGDGRALLAMRMFAHRARQSIGAHAVTLGGIDALVFTGGIGEHSAEIRAAICEGLACLGLELDDRANAAARPDAIVSSRSSRGRILVLTAREDLTMARAASNCLRALRDPSQASTARED